MPGIQGLLFDEYQTTTEDGAPQPGYRLADGAFRPVGPNAEAAALRHPERFAFLMRVDLRDPGIEGWIETLAAAPGFKALRTLVFTPSEGAVIADGGCDRLLHAARAYNLPVFITCRGGCGFWRPTPSGRRLRPRARDVGQRLHDDPARQLGRGPVQHSPFAVAVGGREGLDPRRHRPLGSQLASAANAKRGNVGELPSRGV
jgi:hypothetical protein